MSNTASCTAAITTPTGRKIALPTGIFIGNTFSPASDNGSLDTPNPSTGNTLATVSIGTADDIDRAVVEARRAFNTSWGKKSTPLERASLLNKWADLIETNVDEVAELESLDSGKPFWVAKAWDIPDSIACLRYYAGLADKIEGRTIEQTEGQKMAFTKLEPIGVCALVIPWNFPAQMFAWKVAPALAAGNAVVLKPAEQTPLSALRLAQLSVEAGFPPGVINVVNGLGQVAGEALSLHMEVDKIAFTGSTATGKRIMACAAQSNVKKVTLELGGKSPVIVFESADLQQAANWVTFGILNNMGQDCTAGSRCFFQQSVAAEFMSLLKENFSKHQIGDPFNGKTFQGPQVSKPQQERILSYIEKGEKEGAKVEYGGGVWTGGEGAFKNGFYVEPTIFSGCKKGMSIVDEEIFGPVLALAEFDSEEEVLSRANDTVFGLGAGVFSQNADQCMRVISALEAGTVWCNCYVMLSNAVPFGGMKQSGIGRELGIDGLKEYSQVKAVHWNYGEKLSWPLTADL